MEELNNVFDVMHMVDDERVELAAYQLKNVATTCFDQWKEKRDEDAPHPSLACFEEAFLGSFFPRKLKETKLPEFLTLKQDLLSIHEYEVKFTQLSRNPSKMVKDIRSRMSLFVSGMGHASIK